MTDGGGVDPFLATSCWEKATSRLPIVCVDVLPVQYDSSQRVSRVGLIRRKWPKSTREVWCHVGGRVWIGETLSEAADRHLRSSLAWSDDPVIADSPYFVNQYFKEEGKGEGWDPRKHAVASCFTAEFDASQEPCHVGDEALDFRWFPLDALPPEADIWPGTMAMVTHPALISAHGAMESYHALTARSVSHNELLWQTPVLAMTAMAFLLTIALGVSDDWRRALAAGLSAVIAIASAQLFARHSASQLKDAEALNALEGSLMMLPINRKPLPSPRRGLEWPTREALGRRVSRVWWFRSLMLFAVVSGALCLTSTVSAIAAVW